MSPSDPLPRDPLSAGRLPRGAFLALLGLFVVSGAAGLVYEVAWTRRLLLLLGSTSTASAVVLSAFLGGLGLGALFGGRLADRARRPLALYGVLEIAAAIWALAFPFLLSGLSHPYEAMATGASGGVRVALRALIAVIVVVPGAAFVGATFPALLAAAARGGRAAGPAGALLYGINTLGAVFGALWAGFSGLFTLGVMGASRAAAAASAAVGILAVLLARRLPAAPPAAPSLAVPARRISRAPLVLAAFSGFVALGLEASGVRILVFFIEGFTASFAAMLGVFLAGLGLGSLLLGPWLARRSTPGVAAGVLLLLAGVAVLVELRALSGLEETMRGVRRWAYADGDPMAGQRWTALAGSALLFLVPSLLLGATFPLAVRWAAGDDPASAGRASGSVYLASSVGSVLGPVVVLFLGRLWTAEDDAPGGPLLAFALFGSSAAVAGAAFALRVVKPWAARLASGAAVAIALALFAWPAVSGASPAALVDASRILKGAPGSGELPRHRIVVRADETTTASVVETAMFERILYTDEFQAAATGKSYPYMRLLGHLPVIAAARPEHALVIAFGTGTTAGAVSAHPEVLRLEIAETSRAVASLSSFFEGVNGKVLLSGDPRVRLLVDDGRNVLLLHAPDLDVITLEPLLPYTPAALPFYTREFYELARDRLRDGGVLAQWVPVHVMPADLYAALLRTFFQVFPDGSLWFFEQSTILLGHKGSPRPDVEVMARRAAEVTESLGAAGLADGRGISAGFVASGARVLSSLASGAVPGALAGRTVTDDDPFPEAHPSPRAGFVTYHLAETLHWLATLASPDDGAVAPETALLSADRLRGVRIATARGLFGRAEEAAGDFFAAQGRTADALASLSAATEAFREALPGLPSEDATLRGHMAGATRRLLVLSAHAAMNAAARARAAGDASGTLSSLEDARALAKRAVETAGGEPNPFGRPAATVAYAETLLLLGRCAEAEEVLLAARQQMPYSATIPAFLSALAARRRGRPVDPGLEDDVRRALDAAPPCADAARGPMRLALEEVLRALADGQVVPARRKAELLLAGLGEAKAHAEDVAQAIRAAGDSGRPEIRAERAALLRLVAPADATLAEMLAAQDEEIWRPALGAASHWKFGRLALGARVTELFVASKDRARRLAFASVALEDGSPFAFDRLADLLGDSDEAVRADAYAKIRVAVPAAKRADVAFDATAPLADRERAQAAIRAWLATRPR